MLCLDEGLDGRQPQGAVPGASATQRGSWPTSSRASTSSGTPRSTWTWFPEPTGAFLRAELGGDYVSVGLTFHHGTVNALPDFTAQRPQTYTVAPAPADTNEYTLDQVRHRDFAIDLRTAPPAARRWLAQARPTRSYGLYWSTDDPSTALGDSYDVVVHLHQVRAADLRS